MIFKQFRYEPLGQASYLLGCAQVRDAFIVDPIAELGPDFYLLEAADLGLTITGVLETHIHADYISCARGLAETCGCGHFLGEAAISFVRYAFTPVRDGQVLKVGKVEVRVVATPGHTPEHVVYLVADAARALDPWFVLTGDSLLVGDVGRPDVPLGDTEFDVMDEAERAAVQWRSVHERLLTLPDHVEVYPSHYGGSACGGVNMSGKASSTVGFEKRHNRALAQEGPLTFAAFVRETARPFPEQYDRVKSINLGRRESELVR